MKEVANNVLKLRPNYERNAENALIHIREMTAMFRFVCQPQENLHPLWCFDIERASECFLTDVATSDRRDGPSRNWVLRTLSDLAGMDGCFTIPVARSIAPVLDENGIPCVIVRGIRGRKTTSVRPFVGDALDSVFRTEDFTNRRILVDLKPGARGRHMVLGIGSIPEAKGAMP